MPLTAPRVSILVISDIITLFDAESGAMMKSIPTFWIYSFIILLTATAISFSDSPPANTIPIVGLKPSYEEIDTEFFCFLSWHHFDGLSRQFYDEEDILENVVLSGDTTGMITLVNPNNLTWITQTYSHMFAMDTDSAYARPGWNGYKINDTTTIASDTLLSTRSTFEMIDMMEAVAEELDTLFNQESHSVWFYYGYDEAPANQWNRMVNESSAYDNFIPSLFTQAMDSVYRPELELASDSTWQPTLEEVDKRGTLSWMNHYIKQQDSIREINYIISCMHTITDWAGFHNKTLENNNTPPRPTDLAQAVRSLFSMEYQGYVSGSIQPAPESNHPSFLALDAYPFRLVGTKYQVDSSYTQLLGDSLENWMLDHYEVGMDSTFITAWNIRNDSLLANDIAVLFVPQSFGRAGGKDMWNDLLTVLKYGSYAYRIPTPQEFRMTCNSGLIRGAKAILPYCLTSYNSGAGDLTDAGLLDENNIPFDAPYEEWVYMDRPTDSLSYISPDSIAPFINGYDPFYDLPPRPTSVLGSQRNTENFLLWKFSAYGRLFNSVKKTFAEIARVAPELALLNWWEYNQNNADIDYDGTEPSMFREPQIKVFTDEDEDNCYLYYLNTFCRADNNPFEIVVESSDFPPNTPFSEYALDHSRRFIIEGEFSGQDTYIFTDTLDAGEARLLQMFHDENPLLADIRITDPDLFVILPYDSDTLSDCQSYPGTPVAIHASFYNMGMNSLNNIFVYLKDETNNVMLDTAKVSFEGLSTSSCYEQDRAEAVFTWTPDSTDIGVHRLRVFTQELNEPDITDNDAELVYVVKPRDYATEILNNPWDMTEATSTPFPIWNTEDIKSMIGWNTSLFTDSVSGMFEGGISDPTQLNRMFLNTGHGSSDWIDADEFVNFSLIGKASRDITIELYWIDSHGDTSHINPGISLTSSWQEIDPVDLSAILGSTWGGNLKKLWIEFNGGNLPVSIRIGFIKLTE